MQDGGKSVTITDRCVHRRAQSERDMFGYVTICKPELKVKDFEKYKAYYCGLCEELRERYGLGGQMTLTYDMTFLVNTRSSVPCAHLSLRDPHPGGGAQVQSASGEAAAHAAKRGHSVRGGYESSACLAPPEGRLEG